MGYVYVIVRISPVYYIVTVVLFISIWMVTKNVACSLLSAYCFMIIAATVLSRDINSVVQYDFKPFVSYKDAFSNRDTWWQIACNVGMAVPIGLLLPVSMNKSSKCGKRLLITLVVGISFSIFIEALQFILHRGYSETDDVISSLIGLLIGFIIYGLIDEIISWVRKNKSVV